MGTLRGPKESCTGLREQRAVVDPAPLGETKKKYKNDLEKTEFRTREQNKKKKKDSGREEDVFMMSCWSEGGWWYCAGSWAGIVEES